MTALGRQRLAVLSLALVFVVTLLVLAASLTRLEFAPGQTYSLPSRAGRASDNPPPLPSNRWMDYLNMIFWALAALLLVAALVAAILSKEYRKELLLTALVCLVLAVGFYSFLHERAQPKPIEPPPEEAPLQLQEPPVAAPVEPVNPPRWSPFLLFLVLLGMAGLLGWRFLPRFWQRREGSLEGLAGLAGAAAAQLRGGAAVRDTVLRCYAEMSELLGKREQIPSGLRKCLTPREFERLLERAGVRSEHVARLSRLFEKVRYGGRRTGPEEAGEAISCLEAIQQAYGREAT
ncbi:MAG: DUF4129 domain-containing protein [Candidatus Acetothermia bacterium]|jgi:membrane protein implicated in regulation of membrane protease activity|nr:DUF4129 domain-containing protein [Candidatus Acetothermia bacterium]MDH7505132.1 DUF4129 domain-containing protein [Candidatus Acetothermia bacterium]